MAPNIIFVTGGNSGIGYETVKALLESEKLYQIILGSRSVESGRAAIESLQKEVPKSISTVELIEIDVTSDESIEKAFEHVKSKYSKLDTLINNAGATFDIAFLGGKVSLRDCFNKAYDVNVAGLQVVTWTFIPLLLKSSDPRLLLVTGLSGMIQASQNYFPTPPLPAGWPKQIAFETIGYRCSKTALNMLVLDWAHKLKADGVKVWGTAPGMLATNLGGMKEKAIEMGAGHASIGGKFFVSVVEGARDADAGKLIQRDGITPF